MWAIWLVGVATAALFGFLIAASQYSPVAAVVWFVVLMATVLISLRLQSWRDKTIERQRGENWPILAAWAQANGWRVRYVEKFEWTYLLKHSIDAGPYLTVSGVVDGVPVDVIRLPWTDDFGDGLNTGVEHVVLLPMAGRPDAKFRGRRVRGQIFGGMLIARVLRHYFEVRPQQVPEMVALVRAALNRHDARVSGSRRSDARH